MAFRLPEVNEKTDEVVSRTVFDPDGHAWHLYVVHEGLGWDAEMESRRVNWLCCSSLAERRFVSPIPESWRIMTDAELVAMIAVAQRDARRFH